MSKYVCTVCGYVYDPVEGDSLGDINPGTAFADLPEDWTCPECGVGKDQFDPVEDQFYFHMEAFEQLYFKK